MKGYPKILLKTKGAEFQGQGYPAILLKADEMSEASYDVIANIRGRDPSSTSEPELSGKPSQGEGTRTPEGIS
jgi:hypothetical protein